MGVQNQAKFRWFYQQRGQTCYERLCSNLYCGVLRHLVLVRVACWDIIRILLAVAVEMNWKVYNHHFYMVFYMKRFTLNSLKVL